MDNEDNFIFSEGERIKVMINKDEWENGSIHSKKNKNGKIFYTLEMDDEKKYPDLILDQPEYHPELDHKMIIKNEDASKYGSSAGILVFIGTPIIVILSLVTLYMIYYTIFVIEKW